MDGNIQGSQTNSPTGKRNIESPLYNTDKLISLSSQAKILAWVILVLSIIFIVAATINFLWGFVTGTSYAYHLGLVDFLYYLVSLSPAFIGLILYIILRIVAEGVLLLMDLEIDLRARSERQM